MQYLLNEQEHEEYMQLKRSWEQKTLNQLSNEIRKLKREGKAKIYLSPFEVNLFCKEPQFINVAEYAPERKQEKNEVGEYSGVKLIEFPRV